jgi:hypothetical protein
MDMHNDPIDYAVMVADDRVRRLLHERGIPQEPGQGRRVANPRFGSDRPSGWVLRMVAAEPLIVGAAGFLLGWLVSQGG